MLRNGGSDEQDGPVRSDPSRGTNQTGIKLYNERLVLSLIRTHGPLSKGEVSRMTGLSAQASSVIMKQLEVDGLLLKGPPQRGKVGQPSVPMSLNPEGAFSIGFKIGRRSSDIVLMDLTGGVRRILRESYAYPTPEGLLDFLKRGLDAIVGGMSDGQITRIRGLGVAAPTEMWSWGEEFGAPAEIVEAWRRFPLQAEIEAVSRWPVHAYNDGTAACAAELAFGAGRAYPNFFYVFIATLVGGGVVLDGSLYPGRRGYAGSIGSAPIPALDPGRPTRRLIQSASLSLLERMAREAGMPPADIPLQQQDDWSHLGPILDQWIEQATDSLASVVGSIISVIDFNNIVIDGRIPASVRAAIVERTRHKLAAMDMQGVAPVEIVEGYIGSDARVLGAACLPLLAAFAKDRDILFSQSGAGRETRTPQEERSDHADWN